MIINGQTLSVEELETWDREYKSKSNLATKSINFIIELGMKIGYIISIARMTVDASEATETE